MQRTAQSFMPHCIVLHYMPAWGAELSTSTVIVPVTGVDVSTTTVQFLLGRATARGNPAFADTCTLVNAIWGKTRSGQKSNDHVLACVCVRHRVACVPTLALVIELCAILTPSIVNGPLGSGGGGGGAGGATPG